MHNTRHLATPTINQSNGDMVHDQSENDDSRFNGFLTLLYRYIHSFYLLIYFDLILGVYLLIHGKLKFGIHLWIYFLHCSVIFYNRLIVASGPSLSQKMIFKICLFYSPTNQFPAHIVIVYLFSFIIWFRFPKKTFQSKIKRWWNEGVIFCFDWSGYWFRFKCKFTYSTI